MPAPFYIGIAKDEKLRKTFLERGNRVQKRKVKEAIKWLEIERRRNNEKNSI